jgi:ubiquinone/menaquinone biosynthesis C-methylase UbiE
MYPYGYPEVNPEKSSWTLCAGLRLRRGQVGYLLDGNNVVGVDLFKAYLEEAKKFEQVVLASASALPFRSASFDAVLAAELVEHMPKIEGYTFLKELKRVSAKQIVLTTPRDFEHLFYGSEHPETHKSHWTKMEILTALE